MLVWASGLYGMWRTSIVVLIVARHHAMNHLALSTIASFVFTLFWRIFFMPPISHYGSTIIYPAQQGNHKNGSAVVFSCKHCFYLTGPPVIKCSGNTWTPVNFKCFLSKSFFFLYRTMLIVEVSESIDADSWSLSKRTALERSTIMALEYRNNSLLRHSWYIHVRATRRETCLAHARNPILSSFIVSLLYLWPLKNLTILLFLFYSFTHALETHAVKFTGVVIPLIFSMFSMQQGPWYPQARHWVWGARTQ